MNIANYMQEFNREEVGPAKVPWTLSEGVAIARMIEGLCIGWGYHCCLGGSCLHAGKSHKDLDIYLYDRSGVQQLEPDEVVDLLTKCTSMLRDASQNPLPPSCGEDRYVYRMHIDGRRIDVFFLCKVVDHDIDYDIGSQRV